MFQAGTEPVTFGSIAASVKHKEKVIYGHISQTNTINTTSYNWQVAGIRPRFRLTRYQSLIVIILTNTGLLFI